MTKADLINYISEKAGITRVKAETVVNTIFDSMVESLLRDERIEIRGFGSFVNRSYGSYQGRNPKTGSVVQVQPKRVPFFKVGKELKEMVDPYNFPREGYVIKPLAEDTDGDDDEC
jgi:integration host factor subunit beta